MANAISYYPCHRVQPGSKAFMRSSALLGKFGSPGMDKMFSPQSLFGKQMVRLAEWVFD